MATKLTAPVTRTVVDGAGNPLIVTLTVDGITFRRPRRRESYLLPYSAGETRAEVLAAGGIGMARTGRTVSRGVLATERGR